MGELELHLLRYGEIGTKSPNVRKHFEDILMQNIERTFLSREEEVITEKRGRGRIFAYALKKNSYLFSRIFGLTSYSRARQVNSDLDELKKEGRRFADEVSGSFAVRARRVGEHEYNSQEVEAEIGDVILDEDPDLKV
ncbi:MAG: THUMP domain-containing protein, partial [Candidatus Thermoplasmatota archaeon]